MAPIAASEVSAASSEMDPSKAPGSSNHHLKLYTMAFKCESTLKRILLLLDSCLERGRVPRDWREGVIILIPKTASAFTGTVDGMRPITLLETLSKLLMNVLQRRIYNVTTNHQVLRGARYYGAPGTSTTAPIALLHAAASQAAQARSDLWVYMESKSKAYDCVPHIFLLAAMERIHLHASLTQFYFKGFLKDRKARVLTAYGPTENFDVHRGIPQGGVESPFLFNVFYDVLLCALNNDPAIRGVEIKATAGPRAYSPPVDVLGSFTTCAVAYMDDAAFFSTNRNELQAVVAKVDEFNALTNVRANAAKGCVLAALQGKAAPSDDERIMANGAPVSWVPRTKESRYLGIWVDGRRNHDGAAVNAAAKEAEKAVRVLRGRFLPSEVTVWLLNVCVIPAIVYRTKAAIPPLHLIEKWQASLSGIVRRSLCGLNRLPAEALSSAHLFGLKSIKTELVKQHVTDMLAMLCSPNASPEGTAVRSQIGLLQGATRCPVSPLERPDLALRTWEPRIDNAVTWFDQLLPLLAAAKLSIRDLRGEFNLGQKGEPMKLPIAKWAPGLLLPRKHGKGRPRDLRKNGVGNNSGGEVPVRPVHDLQPRRRIWSELECPGEASEGLESEPTGDQIATPQRWNLGQVYRKSHP
jgi:hypothetical protein